MARIILFSLFLLIVKSVSSQIIIDPLIKDKTHETMNVSAIIHTDTSTIIYISVTNRLDSGGWFCADTNIFIQEAPNDFARIKSGNIFSPASPKKYTLINAKGIPACPSRYNFQSKDEVLEFELHFPSLNPKPDFIDIIEDCSDNCFKLEGVCLKDSLAFQISIYQEAFDNFEAGKIDTALNAFKKIIEIKDTNYTMYSYALYNIPGIYEHLGKKEEAIFWHKEVLESALNDSDLEDASSSSMSNFKHNTSIRLAALYKSMGKPEEALTYLWIADTLYPLQDTSKILKSQEAALILTNKLKCYLDLKKYDEAIFVGINQIVNEEIAHLYDNQADMLVNLIKQEFDKKKFQKEFDKALLKMTVFEEEDLISGRFKFQDQQYKITVNRDYIVLAMDSKTKEIRKAIIQDKDNNFFIERVKVSDFYKKLIKK